MSRGGVFLLHRRDGGREPQDGFGAMGRVIDFMAVGQSEIVVALGAGTTAEHDWHRVSKLQ